MPLYTNIGGAQREIKALYTNVGGAQKEIRAMYANVAGAQKEIFSPGNKYYKISGVLGTDLYEAPQHAHDLAYSSGFDLVRDRETGYLDGNFKLNPVLRAKSFLFPHYYISLDNTLTSEGTTLKLSQTDVNDHDAYQVISYYGFNIDFESESAYAVQAVTLPDNSRSYYITSSSGSGYDLYISADFSPMYRFVNSYVSPTSYWFRPYYEIPSGYEYGEIL